MNLNIAQKIFVVSAIVLTLMLGDIIVGTIGSQKARNFTVMGDPVNLGSRLEGANKAYGTRILVSERTQELAGLDGMFREIDLIQVKGKTKATRIFELGSHIGKSSDIDQYSVGLMAYRDQNWNAAELAFNDCNKCDPTVTVYLERIQFLK